MVGNNKSMQLKDTEKELISRIRSKAHQTVTVKIHDGEIVHIVVEESIKVAK